MECIKKENLVSNNKYSANYYDAKLLNSMGMVYDEEKGTLWVANNKSGIVSSYDKHGKPLCNIISIPLGNPSALVINHNCHNDDINIYNNKGFYISNGYISKPAYLIIVTDNGTICGYNPEVDECNAITVVNNIANNSIYTGITLVNNKIYVSDYNNNRIEVYDNKFNKLGGFSFIDTSIAFIIPPNFTIFNIVNLNGRLYVTYVLKISIDTLYKLPLGNIDNIENIHNNYKDIETMVNNKKILEEYNNLMKKHKKYNGYINVFDYNGNFIKRFITKLHMDAPYGISLMPFGNFAQNIVVGNHNNGTINIYDFDGNFLIKLIDKDDNINGLWTLVNIKHKLYFDAGADVGKNGLIGYLKSR